MSTNWFFAGLEDLVPGVAAACFNLFVALALVTISLLLVIAVSSVAWLYDRPNEVLPIRYAVRQTVRR
jgi:hypothetical protein